MSESLTKARFCLTSSSTHHEAISLVVTHSFLWLDFSNRLVEVIDQAQHFAGLGPAGGGGQSGDAALMFREGLDVTERELEVF
jgi:hypothetical protein